MLDLIKKPLVSILIANYNNGNLVKKCVKSCKDQTYKNIEIILIDDKSKDNSLKVISKLKGIKFIKTKKNKTNVGAFNQMNAYYEAFKKSKGKIIFLCDSDDFFHKKKVDSIVRFFHKNKSKVYVHDLAVEYDRDFNYRKKILRERKFNLNIWPRFSPTSCISVKRNYFKKCYKKINFSKFPNIWMDFRMSVYFSFIEKNYYVLAKHYTYYFRHKNSISSQFEFFSKNWWSRRLEAHKYMEFFLKKNKIKYKFSLDFFICNLINTFR